MALVHVSCDEVNSDALKWAQDVGFTWPTVLFPDLERAGLTKYDAWPGEVRLVDSEGSVLTKDEGEAFATISQKN
ncbi:MAG TPA: hypothetical protein DIV39_04250 [Verrucomicrobiales bacterium]|nr:hypothetical protein [Verrucomicrobiales bacterium]